MESPRLLLQAAAFAALTFSMAPLAFSQMGGGMGMGPRRANRIYNPATETTVKGTVEEVKTFSGRGAWNGTHLTLKTKSGAFDVHLGPSAYIAKEGFKFAKGDQIEVTGSKVKYQGHDAIIAREVKMGGKTLTLRDAQGFPAWAGGRRMMMK